MAMKPGANGGEQVFLMILFQPEGVVPVPTRLAYPDNETFNNAENYNAAIESQFGGEDSIYGTVWWDE